MKQETKSKILKLVVQSSPQEVFAAFTNANALCEWLCDVAQADAQEGGRLYLWWRSGYYASGEYSRLVPDEKVVFSWHGRNEPGITQVKVSIRPVDSGSELTLTHANLGTGNAWKKTAKEIKKGWLSGLINLKSVLETGQDLRLVNRPILGASIDILNAEVAKSLGVPVKKGVRLLNVVDGLGAQIAGLQKDDVVVKMDGDKISSIEDYRAVIDRHRAGDKIKLTFYRGAEKHSVGPTLSLRPAPEIPATLDELIASIKKGQVEAERAISHALSGATDREVTFRHAPEEWNAKEILAHLIILERDTQSWLSGTIQGQGTFDVDSHSHELTRLQALASAFPNHVALLTELKRSHKETLGILQGLPAEIVTRKGTYWRIATILPTLPGHVAAHAKQIKTLIETARTQVNTLEDSSLQPADTQNS